jgi:hypothetical protein
LFKEGGGRMRGRDTRDEFDRGILYEYVEVSQ